MKIGFFDLEGWEEKILKREFKKEDGFELFFSNQKIDKENLPEKNDFDIISIFINSTIDKKVLDNLCNLKLITTRSTGFDHIDLEECKKRNIKVAYVPGYGDNTVAEFTFGLILNLTRKIYYAIDRIKEKGDFSLEGLRGEDIKGKILGVIGTGRIGKEVIKIAKGFSMKILAFDPYPDKLFQKQMGFEYVEFDYLLKNSDIITIHCPLLQSTYHLINKENIKLIKKSAYLINTARGPIIETEALIEALNKGILKGVALDVLEEEGEIKDELNFLSKGHPKKEELKNILYDHILMEMDNVLITPHNAFNSQEALERILKITIENIKEFLKGRPKNLIKS